MKVNQILARNLLLFWHLHLRTLLDDTAKRLSTPPRCLFMKLSTKRLKQTPCFFNCSYKIQWSNVPSKESAAFFFILFFSVKVFLSSLQEFELLFVLFVSSVNNTCLNNDRRLIICLNSIKYFGYWSLLYPHYDL